MSCPKCKACMIQDAIPRHEDFMAQFSCSCGIKFAIAWDGIKSFIWRWKL